MKKIWSFFCVLFCLFACSDKISKGDYPLIDVTNSVGKYQRVYCSDYFSSIELIPLETKDNCLINNYEYGSIFDPIIYNEDYIFMMSRDGLFAFDHSGMFLNPIGAKGQGPREYVRLSDIFLNKDRPTIFISDMSKILEYDFHGNFIRSFPNPIVEDVTVTGCSYVADRLFVGQTSISSGKNKYRYCLFDENGIIVKCFPNYIYFDRVGFSYSTYDKALRPIRVDDHIYLKDVINDTIYILDNLTLQPAYILGLGKYTFSKEFLEKSIEMRRNSTTKAFVLMTMKGTPKYFFYIINVPDIFPRPKTKKIFEPASNQYYSPDMIVFGIYNIELNVNTLLDTDDYLQKGIINDINGGLPFFPRYYAGNNVVVDIWYPEEMKEMLTDEYFAKQTIKNPQSHQKLKELLNNLKEDDNPIVVVAKLK